MHREQTVGRSLHMEMPSPPAVALPCATVFHSSWTYKHRCQLLIGHLLVSKHKWIQLRMLALPQGRKASPYVNFSLPSALLYVTQIEFIKTDDLMIVQLLVSKDSKLIWSYWAGFWTNLSNFGFWTEEA